MANEKGERSKLLSRLGYWYFDSNKLRIEHGVRPFLSQMYEVNKLVFYSFLAMVIYSPLAIWIDEGYFERGLGILFISLFVISIFLLCIKILFVRKKNVTTASAINISDISYIKAAYVGNSPGFVIYYKKDGEIYKRVILLPPPAFFRPRLNEEMERAKETIKENGIILKENTAEETG